MNLQTILLLKNYFLKRYQKISYAQEGEDLIIERIFENKNTGFYIDVGAHHPLRFSNTMKLYDRGWHGINIDANPNSMSSFQLLRPRDINLELAIGVTEKRQKFYIFNETAINTFDQKIAKHNQKAGYLLKETRLVKTTPLSKIINRYAPKTKIDLLSIDIEGFDYQALNSMDWKRLPTLILIETLGLDLSAVVATPSHRLLTSKHYKLYAKTANTCLYLLT